MKSVLLVTEAHFQRKQNLTRSTIYNLDLEKQPSYKKPHYKFDTLGVWNSDIT